MADQLFLVIVLGFVIIVLTFSGIGIINNSRTEYGIDYKKRRIGLLHFTSGFFLLLLSVSLLMHMSGLVVCALGFFFLIPANEFARLEYETPYYEEDKIKKYKFWKVFMFVPLFLLFFVGLRIYIGESLVI